MEKTLFVLSTLVAFLFCGTASAGETTLQVKMDCNAKIGVCVPAGSQVSNADARAFRLAASRLAAAKKVIAEAQSNREMLEGAHGKLDGLEKAVANLKAALDNFNGRLGNVQEENGKLKSGQKKQAAAMAVRLRKELAKMDAKAAKLNNRLSDRFYSRRINLEVGVLGGAAYVYGATGGAAIGLALPLGDHSLWTARFKAGMGVSPSAGVGWMAMGTVTRFLAKGRLEIGPAVVAMGDAGNLLGDGSSAAWVLGAGAEVRFNINSRLFLSAVPFVGVTPKTVTWGTEWVQAVYRNTDCGSVLVQEGYYASYNSRKTLEVTGGGLLGFGVNLF